MNLMFGDLWERSVKKKKNNQKEKEKGKDC